ncbi:peptidylprolyl isomerase [uncultured Desulfosarcina sp.]|uniref:peptidylprolyl isomerase n=1 Tax=uncultured Desulfosarcina sp. TaxID=218289 RepID=UPI0029C86C21|nr:peptidylprolyl isomerase [uncultured Desulfosarcina sp.]
MMWSAGGCLSAEAADSPAAKPADDDVLARIGDRTITRQEIDLRVSKMAQKRRRKPSDTEIATLVDQLVEQTLFAEEARCLNLDKDPQVQMLIQETLDKMLANLYVYRHLLPGVQVSEAEVADYYKAHKSQWKQPETVHARHILLRVDRQATASVVQTVEAKALEIRRRLAAGEDFAQLAKMLSEDTGTRNKGGDLGFFDRKGKAKPISDAAFSLKDGEIGQPVRSSVGYHILQTLEHQPAGVKTLESVRGDIRSHLLREKKMSAAKKDRLLLERKYNVYVSDSVGSKKKADGK